MKDRRHRPGTWVVQTSILAIVMGTHAAAAETGIDGQLSSVVNRGVDYLALRGQAVDGSFSSQAGIGVTALATAAMLRNGRTARDVCGKYVWRDR